MAKVFTFSHPMKVCITEAIVAAASGHRFPRVSCCQRVTVLLGDACRGDGNIKKKRVVFGFK